MNLDSILGQKQVTKNDLKCGVMNSKRNQETLQKKFVLATT